MADSLREFGGPLACTLVLAARTRGVEPAAGETVDVRIEAPTDLGSVWFAEKVAAAAHVERIADADGVDTLAWVDAEVLFTAPPIRLSLDPAHDVAVRPVHHRNVGLRPDQPIDAFWAAVYRHAGGQAADMVVRSFVDDEPVRAYFNTHVMAVRPSVGLFTEWARTLSAAAQEGAGIDAACADDRHRVFLHQAVLSALIVERVPWDRIDVLPPTYSYPYNLHSSIPPERRARSMSDLVCVVCEGREMAVDAITDMRMDGRIREWIALHPAWP